MKVGRTFTVGGTVAEDPIRARAILAPATGSFRWAEDVLGREPGSRVRAGQTLGSLLPEVPADHWSRLEEDIAVSLLEIESAQAELARVEALAGRELPQAGEILTAEAAIRTARVDERRAHKERTRVRKLVKDGLLPGRRLSELDAAAAKARIEREGAEAEKQRLEELVGTQLLQQEDILAAKAAVARAQAAYDAAVARLGEKTGQGARTFSVVTEHDGIITEVLASHGHHVEMGAPVVHLVSDETVLLQIEVSMFDVERLDEIQQIWVRRPGEDGATDLADLGAERVTEALLFDPERLTATISYRSANGGRFHIGQFVEARIMLDAREELPVIPQTAIVEINTIPYVFVALSGEGYARRRVVPGQTVGDLVAIHAGVEDGEWVVTEGGFDLYVTSLTGTLQSHQH